jgi:hypothetical protein
MGDVVVVKVLMHPRLYLLLLLLFVLLALVMDVLK